jgi:hypothetical protein
VAPLPPSALVGRPNPGTVALTWRANAEPDVASYQVYRATEPIDALGGLTPLASVSGAQTTTFIDESAAPGTTYYYRVAAVDAAGNVSAPSAEISTSPLASTLALDIRELFGETGRARSYKLVALPGDVSIPVESTLGGTAGQNWQAHWDTGDNDTLFVAFTDTFEPDEASALGLPDDLFAFVPGRGYWLLSDSPWDVSEPTPSAVELSTDGTFAIDLRPGWNIVSNPLDVDVPWQDVVAANDGAPGALWQWSGGFVQSPTFLSAQTGEAFYVFNDPEEPLAELVIPYPGFIATGSDRDGVTVAALPASLVVEAQVGSRPVARVRVRLADEAADGWDALDYVAPPAAPSQATTLRLRAPERPAAKSAEAFDRTRFLAQEARPTGAAGHAFDLVLTGREPVRLAASGFDAVGGQRVVLVETATARAHDLAPGAASVQIVPEGPTTHLRLLMGDAAFVAAQQKATPPTELRLLPGYPNPFRERATVAFALPEAGHVQVAVYDVLGRRVATLADRRFAAGLQELTWRPQGLSSGVYFVRLEAAGRRFTQRLVRVR